MKIAVISDIHSNIYALESVLEDLKEKEIDNIYCLGDLVGYFSSPNEVIKKIKEKNIKTVKGNHDLDLLNYEKSNKKSFVKDWTFDNIEEENFKFLFDLPELIEEEIKNYKILFCHGSPRDITEYLKENSNQSKEVMDSFDGDILVCGHTHLPYYKYYGNKLLVNAGSVGKPKIGKPSPTYLILDFTNEKLKIEIIEIDYEFNLAANDALLKGFPEKNLNLIKTGSA